MSAAHEPGADAPDRWWGNHLGEARSVLELGRLLLDPVFVPLGLPRGDGRAVLLMPGFLAGDQTMLVLGRWLRRLGYRPGVCGFVANVDCSDRAAARVERRVRALYERSGRRVALIGHSRGGHFARALAARLPDHVSHALSLGADLQGMFGISAPTEWAVGAVRSAVERSGRARAPRCLTADCGCSFAVDYGATFPRDRVRMTSIYSRGDGVVRWRTCQVPYADCVEVPGSHTGLIFNHHVYRAIARALAEPELS
ncbi:MAG TPA: alpha/beta hydrolase-fold protein [Solirubrobacteraceae bacterium]|nr:alpha/beta hydrolase-fold protein [Solirubrobacteraceae bacterium]